MSTLLEETKSINYSNPIVDLLYNKLDTQDISQYLKNCFYYCRDSIKFEFCSYQNTMSDTIQIGKGQCYHKALVMVGLCRKKKIEAGFLIQKADSKLLEPFVLQDSLIYFTKNQLYHVVAAIKIQDWILVDTTFDLPLLKYLGIPDWTIQKDWDATCNITSPHTEISSDFTIKEKIFEDNAIPKNTKHSIHNKKLLEIRKAMGSEL